MMQQIEARRSIRKYKNDPVPEEKLLQILESARLAPSGSNTQPWHFIVVRSEDMRRKLATASHKQEWMLAAPVLIVCVADLASRISDSEKLTADDDSSYPELKKIIRDTSIAIEHLVLEAENQGLGTCWVAWFTQEQIRPILDIPSDKYVVSIITLGYADETPKARPRKKLEAIVHFEKW